MNYCVVVVVMGTLVLFLWSLVHYGIIGRDSSKRGLVREDDWRN